MFFNPLTITKIFVHYTHWDKKDFSISQAKFIDGSYDFLLHYPTNLEQEVVLALIQYIIKELDNLTINEFENIINKVLL
jgi:hypothetical protein